MGPLEKYDLIAAVIKKTDYELMGIPEDQDKFLKVLDDHLRWLKFAEGFLKERKFNWQFCQLLTSIAAGEGDDKDAWDNRCLATLLLENQFSQLPADDLETWDKFYLRLGIKSEPGSEAELSERVLQMGFQSRDFTAFTNELKTRIQRLEKQHKEVNENEGDTREAYLYLGLAAEVEKLAFYPLFFKPEESEKRVRLRKKAAREAKQFFSQITMRPMMIQLP